MQADFEYNKNCSDPASNDHNKRGLGTVKDFIERKQAAAISLK
jgi:hypothetical protein